MIDIHCHILPEMDDGAQNMKHAVAMAQLAAADETKTIIATPHLFKGSFDLQGFDMINEKCKELNKALSTANINLNVLPGAEVHISHNLSQEIQNHYEYMVLNRSSYMLLEFPSAHVFPGAQNLFFDLMGANIRPIIAHPERNSVFINKPQLLYELLRLGGLAQANSGSFAGLYGRTVQSTANLFLDWNFYNFVGSDGHNTSTIPPQLSATKRYVAKRKGERFADALFELNPRAILRNNDLPYRPDPTNPQEAQRSFKIKLPGLFNRKRNNHP
ncbi:tyrosine-protein phosphatase [Acidobacteriota bacterium]